MYNVLLIFLYAASNLNKRYTTKPNLTTAPAHELAPQSKLNERYLASKPPVATSATMPNGDVMNGGHMPNGGVGLADSRLNKRYSKAVPVPGNARHGVSARDQVSHSPFNPCNLERIHSNGQCFCISACENQCTLCFHMH